MNFVTFWVQWGLNLDHFTLKITELHCNVPLYGYQPISACGVDKKLPKMVENLWDDFGGMILSQQALGKLYIS